MTDDEAERIKAEHEQLVNANCALAAANAQFQLTVKSLTEDLERARCNEEVMSAEKWLKRFNKASEELDRERIVASELARTNVALQAQLNRLDDLLNEQPEEATTVPIQRLSDILRSPLPEPVMPSTIKASFHLRNSRRPDGYWDFFPGDGFGFIQAAKGWLMLSFEVGGVSANSHISYEALAAELAREGHTIVPLVDVQVAPPHDAYAKHHWGVIQGQRVYIEELQNDLKYALEKVDIGDKIIDEMQAKLEEKEGGWSNVKTVEDQRVLDAAAALTLPGLRFMSSQEARGFCVNVRDFEPLNRFVSFELERRIANADLDLPHYRDPGAIIEIPHAQLFAELAKAEEEGAKAKAMTKEQREDRYEAYLREHGYVSEGEQLNRRRKIKDGLAACDEAERLEKAIAQLLRQREQERVNDDDMQIRPVQGDGAPEPKQD